MGEARLQWTDVREIAIRLVDSRPDVDPLTVQDVRTLRPTMTVSLGREVWLA